MRRVEYTVARMLSLGVFLVQFVIIGSAEQLTSVFFKSSYLRRGVQPLIENGHHLRVVFAYLKLWCDNSGLRPASFVIYFFFAVLLASIAFAVLIDYFGWTRRLKMQMK